jgi:NADH-quinone oxidoreductase subunit H
VEQVPLLGFFYMTIKTVAVYMLMMVVRGTLPRLRIDQMMSFTWKVMTPLMLVALIGTILIDRFTVGMGTWPRTAIFLGFNLVCLYITLLFLGKYSFPKRKEFAIKDLNA